MILLTGCQDDTELVRQIQNKRQTKQQSHSQRDHLGETFVLLRQFIELEPEKAQRQIAYHLNRWGETKPADETNVPDLIKSVRELIPQDQLESRIAAPTFQPTDSQHLRDSFLFHTLYSWVDVDIHDEQLLSDWFQKMESDKDLTVDQIESLRTATRLFDWTVRNIAVEPNERFDPAPPGPKLPFGMKFRGAGYRQTDYQTVMRGTGDGLQRAGVFTQLCRQAGIPAAVLGMIDAKTAAVTPFCVGVLVGADIYLFEPSLGIFVPGPSQTGIATLAQARRDAVILRRLGISGLDQFTYPIRKENIQQCVALLNLLPEAISPRMHRLQAGLTGDRRMNVYVDADAMAKQFDAVTGISSVRLWDVPLLAEIYKTECEQEAERDPLSFGFWYLTRWAMMEADFYMAKNLAHARWQHLLGQFSDIEIENIQGARTLYMRQRAPEFEIDDLRIDVDLQKAYGVQRELGTESALYDRQVAQVQGLMRQGKRTATYWLSLLQADDDRLETAESWIRKRVLDEQQQSYWIPAARYNMARLAEALGEPERAIKLYKHEGDPQEQGNRIRARLLEAQVLDKQDE